MSPRTPGAGLPEHPDRLWRTPEPKRSYDVVIVGGGGHGRNVDAAATDRTAPVRGFPPEPGRPGAVESCPRVTNADNH